MAKSVFERNGTRNQSLKTDTLYDPALSNEALESAGHEHVIRAKSPQDRKPNKALAQGGKQHIPENQ